MVVLRPNAFLLALLSALVLAVPCASAGVVDRVRDQADNVARVGGLPPIPLLDRLPDADSDVKWTLHDGGAEAEGGGVRTGASCTAGDGDGEEAGCSGYVCFMDPGSGPLPVSLGDWGRGMVGVGVDVASVEALVPIVIHAGTDGAQQQEGAEQVPQPWHDGGGNYGPYDGVFVNPTGHCGP